MKQFLPLPEQIFTIPLPEKKNWTPLPTSLTSHICGANVWLFECYMVSVLLFFTVRHSQVVPKSLFASSPLGTVFYKMNTEQPSG